MTGGEARGRRGDRRRRRYARGTGTSGRSTGSTSGRRAAPCTACSARTARARPPPSASSPRCCGPTRAGSRSRGTTCGRDAARGALAASACSASTRRLDEELSGRQNLEMFGRLYHLGARRARVRADELLERFGLADTGRKAVKQYSGGMRRRLDLAASLITDPDVLFLDEPTTGLDPRGRDGGVERGALPGRRRHDGAAHHAVPGGGRPARRPHLGRSTGAGSSRTARRTN